MTDDGYFAEGVAARYEESEAEMFDASVVEPVVEFLADLAGNGRALELGIGTGRIAIPLAARGVPVHGIELSNAMAARLRAKPGGQDIGLTIGDFATATVDGTFSVAYLVFSTIMNLTTQEAQVACFRDVAHQGLVSHHYSLVEGQWQRFSIPFRYVVPSELDLMAQLAGMRPPERWSGWKREPFTSESRQLVAVWEKPPRRA